MSDKMTAVVKTKPVQGAEKQSVQIPRIEDDEVLVRILATSICGTDVHIYKWDPWSASRIGERRLPQTMGHEMAGDVVEIGKAVKGIRVGDYVSAETHIPDPRDLQTQLGQMHIGQNMSILGVDRDGTFAAYIAVPALVCWVNDRSIPPEQAAVQEPLGNATYAVLAEDNDIAGKSMVIIGDGPTALFSVAVARTCGVTQIFHVGKYEFNMEIGRRLGADHSLYANAKDVDRTAYVLDHTRGFGADLVLDMAGSPQALSEGFKMLRKGGRFTAFGVASESPCPIDYNNGIVFKGCQVHGINGRKMFDTWYRVRNLLSSGRLDITPVITNLLSLDEWQTGFDKMMERPRNAAKVVLFPDGGELAAARDRMAARS